MRLSVAKFLSFLLNPLFLIVLLPFFLVFKTSHDATDALRWTIYSFIFLFILASIVFIAVRKEIFTDMDVSKREQRPLLFFISTLVGIAYLVGLILLKAPYILVIVTIGVMLGIGLISLINKRVKASIHVATLTALVLAVAIGYGGYFYLLLLLIPIVGWSRIRTRRHSLREAITGGLLGGFLSLSVYSMYLAVKLFLQK